MQQVKNSFLAAHKWSKRLAIVFILSFIFIMVNVTIKLFQMGYGSIEPLVGLIVISVTLLYTVTIYLLPGLILRKYVHTLKRFQNHSDVIGGIESLCRRQATLLKYLGITLSIYIILAVANQIYALVLVYQLTGNPFYSG
ncbi:MAG: hypothetical protein KGV56_00980 [Gammaproteobacteria bacterium]|nr:hypothetical protein [Gammaproteobacteria bacterium]